MSINRLLIPLLILQCDWIIQVSSARKNILFLVADDMRSEFGNFFGKDIPGVERPRVYTPHLDELATRSLVLRNAHCQLAVCSPSRTSLLTGRRPDTTHVYDLDTYFRKSGGDFVTIPQFFKERGYTSIGMGKIFHPGMRASGRDDPVSWSEPFYRFNDTWRCKDKSWWAISKEELREIGPLRDQEVTDLAMKTLKRLAPTARNDGKPFFLAVGLHKPHLPFFFPKKFLDYYPEGSIHLPQNMHAPVNMPEIAWSPFGELRKYKDISISGDINDTLDAAKSLELRRAYYAAISYTDSLIGQILRKLEKLGLKSNTIVAFWGDHGFHLGENGEWTKHTNFEQSTHAPMMIHIPGLTDDGIVTEKLTEFVDLFPTLVEAAGFHPLKPCPEDSHKRALCTEGLSLMRLIDNPTTSDWKVAVFSQYLRRQHNRRKIMGYSIRTEQYRYTEWVYFKHKPIYKPRWSAVEGVELYDHINDPLETYNRVDDEQFLNIRKKLSLLLHSGWRNALPASDRVVYKENTHINYLKKHWLQKLWNLNWSNYFS